MPKRSNPYGQPATPSPSPSKKAKSASGSIQQQSTLLSFFPSPRTNKKPQSAVVTTQPGPSRKSSEVIDVDALDSESPPATSLIKNVPKPTFSWTLSAPSHSVPEFPELTVDPILFSVSSFPLSSGVPIPYSFLAHALSCLSKTRSRIAISNVLVNLFRVILLAHPLSLLPATYLLTNTLGPTYEGIELGLGGSILSSALQAVSGMASSKIRQLYSKHGDIGDTAMAAKSKVRVLHPLPSLTVPYVYQSMLSIAKCSGTGAAKQRQKIVEKLILAAKGEEVRYLVRTLAQNLRVGAVRTSILNSLAHAAVLLTSDEAPEIVPLSSTLHASSELVASLKNAKTIAEKSDSADRTQLNRLYSQAEKLLKSSYARHPNFDHLVSALLQSGLHDLSSRLSIRLGIPLMPCLGSPTRSLDEIYDKLAGIEWVAEYKYDGQRAQIHAWRDGQCIHTKIFSRHLEDMSMKYPDIASLVEQVLALVPQTTSFIIDSEIVAVNPSDGSLRSFQELSTRPRKDVQIQDIKVPVAVYAFDLMYLNESSVIDLPFRNRRAVLRDSLRALEQEPKSLRARFRFADSCSSLQGRVAMEAFFQEAVDNHCEGLMVKALDEKSEDNSSRDQQQQRQAYSVANYEPDKRGAWLKLKKDYLDNADSLDLVPVAAWRGQGRKNGWWSPILLAVQDKASGTLVALCKCMSGFSDSVYRDLYKRYPQHTSPSSSPTALWPVEFGGWTGKADIYFKPSEVWEIRGAELTLSPVSVAAKGLVPSSSSRGLSLRFPRFVRCRNDKTIEEASDTEYLTLMWRSQGNKQTGNDEGELIDADDPFCQSNEESEEEDNSG